MNFAAIALDLDGTLLDSNKQVSARNRNAILQCHSRGIRIIFATARPPRTVASLLPEELLHIGSFVYYNGAQVSCRFTWCELHEPIPASLTAEIVDYCVGVDVDVILSLEVRDAWFSLKEVDYSVSMNVKSNPVVKPLEEMKQYDATKILISNFAAYDHLKQRFSGQANILLTDGGQLIQIMSKLASKETAVAHLCDRFGIPLRQVIAFGDDYNDAGLFRVCGQSVAMGNAVEELKRLATEITASNDQDGVAMVLERFLLNPSSNLQA